MENMRSTVLILNGNTIGFLWKLLQALVLNITALQPEHTAFTCYTPLMFLSFSFQLQKLKSKLRILTMDLEWGMYSRTSFVHCGFGFLILKEIQRNLFVVPKTK